MSEVDNEDACVNKLSITRSTFISSWWNKSTDNMHATRLKNLCQILYGLDLPTETVKAEGEGELFRALMHLWFNDNSAIEDIYHILGKSGLCFLHDISIYLSSTNDPPQFVLFKHVGKQMQIVHFDASIYNKNQIDECKQKFMAIPISLNFDNNNKFGHANLLFISLHEINATGKIIVKTEYFEPHGSQYNYNETETSIIKNGIQSLINMMFSDETKYIVETIVPPVDHCPNIRGLQSLVNDSYFEGSCTIFTILYAILKLLNPEYEQRRITEHIYKILQKNDNPVFIMKLIINTLTALLNIEKRGDDYYIINDGGERKIITDVKSKKDAYGNSPKGIDGEIAIDFRPVDSYKTYVGKINDLGQMVTGKLTFKNGDIYEGDFHNGKRTGKGILRFANGDEYEGDFVDGDVYEGDFVNGKMTGKGKIKLKNGDEYEGDFVNGKMTGKGKIKQKNGDEYEGDFVNDIHILDENELKGTNARGFNFRTQKIIFSNDMPRLNSANGGSKTRKKHKTKKTKNKFHKIKMRAKSFRKYKKY